MVVLTISKWHVCLPVSQINVTLHFYSDLWYIEFLQFTNKVPSMAGLLLQSCCRLQESALMEMHLVRPCSSRQANRHLRRGEVGRSWTPHTPTLNWRRVTLYCLVQLVPVSLFCNIAQVLSDTLCSVCIIYVLPKTFLSIRPFLIYIIFHRKNLVGADIGTLFGCSICNLWLHHTDSGWIRGRGHRVSYCQTSARCQLLSGESTARWAEGFCLQKGSFQCQNDNICLLSKKVPL